MVVAVAVERDKEIILDNLALVMEVLVLYLVLGVVELMVEVVVEVEPLLVLQEVMVDLVL